MQYVSARGVPLVTLVLGFALALACAPAAGPGPGSGSAPKPAAEAPRPAAPAARAAARAPATSFQGQTVTVVVPYTAGGAADIMMRQFAPTMAKYLPGNPNVIVENRPGAGGIVGEMYVYELAPKDGKVIGQFSTVFADVLFTPDQAPIDLQKLQWLGSVAETHVTFVRADLGVRNARELMESGKKIQVGDNSPQSTRGIPPRLFLGLLGVEYNFVSGYGSSGDMRLALQRGELNMTQDSLSGYVPSVTPMVRAGEVVPIAQTGWFQGGQVIRDPRVPDVPTYLELLVDLKGEAVKNTVEYRAIELIAYMNGIQRGWVYPPGVPEETVAAVREAIAKAIDDPELREQYQKAVGIDIVSMSGAETQAASDAIVQRFKNSPDVLNRLKELAGAGG
jgi:tripartite-type tricarboxylate transporter receptor subunit TctC